MINSHFHGDHTFGNSAFKNEGAIFVAHKETARLMKLVQPKELARRMGYFKSNNYDPNEVKSIPPDLTFDKELTLYFGGSEVRLFYLGPGQPAR